MNAIAQVEPLIFRVRDGLVVHRRRVTKRKDANKIYVDVAVDSVFGSSNDPKATVNPANITLNPDEVASYAHSLEPTDERSAAALEALHFKPPVREEQLSYENALTVRVVSATMKALLDAGLIKLPKEKAS